MVGKLLVSTIQIFIVGMQKCGTTALMRWMRDNRLAEYMVPGQKKPNLYALSDPSVIRQSFSGLPLLDASVSYAVNHQCFDRFPQTDTKIVMCVRNHFEGMWSAFKMRKLACLSYEGTGVDIEVSGLAECRQTGYLLRNEHNALNKFCAPESYDRVTTTFYQEVQRIKRDNFSARVAYELSFFLSRLCFPHLSVLECGFFYRALWIMTRRYQKMMQPFYQLIR
jgi:hypothetical protein